VGSLLYAGVTTRPDIAYAVESLGRHMQRSGPEHRTAAKRVMRYLNGTRDLGLKFSGGEGSTQELVGYCDADWGGDPDTRRSTTGYVFMLGGAAVSWASRLQPTVALSSAEAECTAVCEATQEAIHLRSLLRDLGLPQRGPTVLHEDNQSCIAMTESPALQRRSKHIGHQVRVRARASGERGDQVAVHPHRASTGGCDDQGTTARQARGAS
jgi:hypothetical protein